MITEISKLMVGSCTCMTKSHVPTHHKDSCTYKRLYSLVAQVKAIEDTLEWYEENARLCRLMQSEGDKGRHALNDDGGKRAKQVLEEIIYK